MNRTTKSSRWAVLWVGTLLGPIGAIGCFEDPTPMLTHGEESGDGDGNSGDGDGDGNSADGTGDGDGDSGDGDTGDGDGDTGDGDGDTGDGDGDTGDGDGDGDGDTGCGEGEMKCNGFCTDVQTDSLNCGNCGTQCADFDLCGEGVCKAEKYVFATSTLYVGNFAQADILCTQAASMAMLPMGTYRAWVSTANASPSTWPGTEGVYHLRQGAVVAYSHADLVDGNLAHPIDRDEYGQLLISAPACNGAVTNAVWTGTTPQGTPSGPDCNAWTSNVDVIDGRVGDASKSDSDWSFVADCTSACNTPLHVYCVQL